MRFEYKYLVENSKLESLRQMILPFVDVDKFADASNKNQYTVRSIYFDTANLDFYYEKIEGIKNRKKVRLRGYDLKEDNDVVFLEIKRKYDIPIVKYRAPVKYLDALDMINHKNINGQIITDIDFPLNNENSKRFFYQLFGKNLRPVILIIYEREAYQSKFDETVRITFDKNLRSKPFPAINELFTENKVRPALSKYFILEVKFNTHFPGWINPVLARLSLKKQAASKYVMAIDSNNMLNHLTKSKIFIHSKWPMA